MSYPIPADKPGKQWSAMVFPTYTFLATFWFASVALATSPAIPQVVTQIVPPLRLPSGSEILSSLRKNNGQRNNQRALSLSGEQPTADYEALNSILSGITFNLPETTVSRSGVKFTLTNASCRDLTIQNIQISQATVNETAKRINLSVDGIEISCDFEWAANSFLLSTSGNGNAKTEPSSSLKVGIDFVSEDYETRPPHELAIGECDANLKIEELTIEDDGIGLIGGIISLLENFIIEFISEELNEMACDEISLLDEEGEELDEFVQELSNLFHTYLKEGKENEAESSIVDPLAVEKNATLPTDSNGTLLWMNFLEMQNMTLDLVDRPLNELAGTLLDPSSSGSDTLGDITETCGVEDFFRSNLLDEDGLLIIDLAEFCIAPEDAMVLDLVDLFQVSIQSISIDGFDAAKNINVFDPIGNYTLQNSLELEYLAFVLELEAVLQPQQTGETEVREHFSIELSVNDVEIDFAIFLGVNKQTLGNVPLGSMSYIDNILPCLLSAADEVQFTALSVKVSDIVPPQVTGFLDDNDNGGSGLDRMISNGIEAFFGLYEGVLIRAMPNFFEMTFRDLMNDYIEDAMNDVEACPAPDDSLDGLVDYRDLLLPEGESVALLGRGDSPYGDLFGLIYCFIDELLASEDALSWLNAAVTQLTGLQSDEDGDLVVGGEVIKEQLDLAIGGLVAVADLEVSEVRISNLGSLGELNLFQPMYGKSSDLNNKASVAHDPEPALRLSTIIVIEGEVDKLKVYDEFELSLVLRGVDLMLKVLAQMMEPSFLNFPLQDLLNIDCWLATFVKPDIGRYGVRVGEPDMGLVLRNLSMTVAEAMIDIKCISCSSPMMPEIERSMQSPEGIEDTTEVVKMLFERGTSLLKGEGVQSNIDRALNEAAYHCPHSPSYQQNFPELKYEQMAPVEAANDDYSFLIAVIVVIAAVLVSVATIAFVTRFVSRRRHNRWLETLDKKQKLELARMQQNEKELEIDLNGRMTSLILSKEIPCLIRLSMPIVIIGNIALFLSGHLSLGGQVNLSGTFAGDSFNIEGFFEFSMAKSTIEMWQAGAKALAILILLFSGVWPYTKQLLTLFVWLAPPKFLSSKRKGSMLHWLDVLGKWSMVDVFVLLMTLASFRLSIKSPEYLAFIPEGLYSINMVVVPMWGLYANMLAQIVSQLSSHFIIHYHRKTIRTASKSQLNALNLTPASNVGSESEKLHSCGFKLDYEASTKHAVIRKGVNWVLFAFLLSFIALVICGCSLPSFAMEVLGLVGLFVESGNQFEEAKKSYSVFDLARMIMDQARYINKTEQYVGLGTLASLLVITVFIIPLAQAGSLATQWFAPLRKKQRVRNTVLNEILSAWQYMEVYVLSIIVAAWQLGGVSEFMINAYCGELEEMFQSLVRFGLIDTNDAQCFRVEASVETASWLLVAASLILSVLNHFIGTASTQKAQDDSTPAERRLHTDRWLHKSAQSMSTDGVAVVNAIDGDQDSDSRDKADVSPISPRFTDYYGFATIHRTKEESRAQSEVLGTAVAPIDD